MHEQVLSLSRLTTCIACGSRRIQVVS